MTGIAETQRPSMFQAAVEAAAGVLPNAPTVTVEHVALAVLRVALPLHETQHADAWKAAHERAVHLEWEAAKANERAEVAEKEVQRYRSFRGEALCGDIERDRNECLRQNEQLRADPERLRKQLAEAAALLGLFVDHEDQPCRFDHHGACQEHGGSGLRRCDVAVGRELLARIRGGGDGPGCLCPHTYQPDGRLVRDGVLAAGCPVHDADARENGDA